MNNKYKRNIFLTIKVFGISIGVIATLILLLIVSISYYISTPEGQQRIQKFALEELSKEFETKIALDSVGVDFRYGDIALFGFNMDDQNGRRMIHADTLYAEIQLDALLRNEINVSSFKLCGTEANLNKATRDAKSNFQFVVDQINKSKKNKKKQQKDEKETEEHKVKFDIDNVKVQNVVVNWQILNDSTSSIEAGIIEAIYKAADKRLEVHHVEAVQMGENDAISISQIMVNLTNMSAVAKGIRARYKDKRLRIDEILADDIQKQPDVQINGITFTNDNGKPRKNVVNPNRGAFDAGHLDVTANLNLKANSLANDSLDIVIRKLEAVDANSGLQVDSLSCHILSDMKTARVNDLSVHVKKTWLKIPEANIVLPSKKSELPEREFEFKTSQITGYTVLRDIAEPFAPVLENFTTPLNLNVSMSGNSNSLYFHKARIWSNDRHFNATADGVIDHLTEKKGLTVHFDIHSSSIQQDFKNKVVRHFHFKEGMVSIVDNVGHIDYQGNLDVKYKWVGMGGHLRIPRSSINFRFGLDGETKYIDGTADVDSIHLGDIIGNKSVGQIEIQADFHFDTTGKRAAKRLGRKMGKLPEGWIKGICTFAQYKAFKLRNTSFNIKSDGDKAIGNLESKGAYVDVSAAFTFVDTDLSKSLKVKPKVRIHGLSKEAKQERKQKKAERKALKEEQKRMRQEAKAVLKAERDSIKAEEKRLKKRG